MKIRKKFIVYLAVFSTLLSLNVNADVIEIEFIGEGKVNAVEANIECSSNCDIESNIPMNTLVATAATNWKFKKWGGQLCDAGNEVIIESNSSPIMDTIRGGAKTLDSADINGDGVSDLATINLFKGKVSTLTNDGNGNFEEKVVAEDLSYPSGLSFFDWDNDGDQDLIVAVFGEKRLKVYLNDGNGDLIFNENIMLEGINPYSIKVIDINNDQQPDLVVSSFSADTSGDLLSLVQSITSAKIEVYLNKNNTFSLKEVLSNNAAITLDAYLTVDSSLVIASAEIIEGEIVLYENSKRTVIDTKEASYGVTFGDIDNNGTIDILAASYRPSILSLYFNQGDHHYTSAKVVAQPYDGVTATAIVDINNDGYDDIATGEFNANKFYYFKTNSYKDCIIKKSGDISLIAEFEQVSSPEIIEEENDNSSSGGSFGWILILILFTVTKKIKANHKAITRRA